MAAKPLAGRRRDMLAGIAVLALFAVTPVVAQAESLFDLFTPSVSPSAVQYNLARAGFVARSAMVRRGDVYVYDVADRYGVPQRLIIDSHSGRVVERYALRPAMVAEAPRREFRPPVDDESDLDWRDDPRPEIDTPMARLRMAAPPPRPRVVEAPTFDDPAPTPPRDVRPRDLAYGGGGGHTTAPTVLVPLADPKPADKPHLKIARPKPSPSPSGDSDASKSAAAAPTASDPAAPVASAPTASAPVTSAPVAAAPQPAAAEPTSPPTTGMVASTGASDATPAAKAPAPPPAPVAKGKAINDIPVAPLD